MFLKIWWTLDNLTKVQLCYTTFLHAFKKLHYTSVIPVCTVSINAQADSETSKKSIIFILGISKIAHVSIVYSRT